VFGDYSKHLFLSAASEKEFAKAKELLQRIGIEQTKVELYERMFLEHVKTIWDSLRVLTHAT
jgi:hypothetical protein